MRSDTPSFYDVLGVATTATPEQIESAWRRLVRQHHPDHANPGDLRSATARTAAINQAYQALRDPVSRKRYDLRAGHDRFGRSGDRQAFTGRPDQAIDALLRIRKERREERIRVVGAAALGVAAVAYSLRVFKVI